MMLWRRLVLLVGVPALIHGVPEARALQRSARLQNGRPRWNVILHSSHPLPLTRTPRLFRAPNHVATATKDRTGGRQEQYQQQQQEVYPYEKDRPMSGGKSNLLYGNSLTSAPIDRLLWPAAGLFGFGILYCLTATGRLTAILRYVTMCLHNAFFAYQSTLVARPLRTKVATGAILAILGDALAQSTTSSTTGASYDKRRAASFAAFDSCYRVFQHFMFPAIIRLCQGNVLNRILPSTLAPVAAAVERTLLYQLVVVPSVYYPVFFAFTGFIQGLSPKESLVRARLQFLRCWRRNLMFWIPTQMFLFGVVSENWQIPFASIMGVLWGAILSLTAGKTTKA